MDRCPKDMLMAQFVLCVHVVIWSVLYVPATCRFPLYAALYVWNMIVKLLHVLGSCICKMTPSVRAPLVTFMYNTVEIWVILTKG